MKTYSISFGDSDRYNVSFNGSKEEFEKSDKLRVIKERIGDFLKERFPSGGYSRLVNLTIEDSDNTEYPDLDRVGIEPLLKSIKRQVEVMREVKELNNNAPFDKES